MLSIESLVTNFQNTILRELMMESRRKIKRSASKRTSGLVHFHLC